MGVPFDKYSRKGELLQSYLDASIDLELQKSKDEVSRLFGDQDKGRASTKKIVKSNSKLNQTPIEVSSDESEIV